jgi:7tm Chemosensory receptor
MNTKPNYNLRSLALQQEDWKAREKVAQLEKRALETKSFNAMRFFNIDRSVLLGVMSTVLTYLIILLQEKK